MNTVRHIIIEGVEYLEDEIPEERRQQIYDELSRRPMETLGCKPIDKTKTA